MKNPNLSELVFDIAERRTADQIESKKSALQKLEAKLAATTLELLALENELSEHQIEPIPQSPVVVEIRTTETHYVSDIYIAGYEEARPPLNYVITCSDINVAYLATIALDPSPPEQAIDIDEYRHIERTVTLAKCGELDVVLKPGELSEDKELTRKVVVEKAKEVADSLIELGESTSRLDLSGIETVLLRKALLQYCRDTDSTFEVLGYTDAPRATDY